MSRASLFTALTLLDTGGTAEAWGVNDRGEITGRAIVDATTFEAFVAKPR